MRLEEFKHIFFGEQLEITGELTEEKANKYFDSIILREKSKELSNIPIDKILYILEKTAYKLCDKDGQYYKEIMEKMPKLIGYSPSMVNIAMDAFKEMLSVSSLKLRLKSFGDYHCLDTFTKDKYAKTTRAVPIGSVLHIAAGNIFLGAIDSLIIGIITKNINILKVSSQDFLFPTLFYRALEEVDKEKTIISYIAITYWKSSNKVLDKIAKNSFDAILLFGGEEAVKNYKNGLSINTQLYTFGPKISFGVVCKDLNNDELREAAKGFAEDIVLWEQRACTSCQNIFIENSDKVKIFIEYLYEALEEKGQEFPQSELDIDSAVEIRKKREIAKWEEFNNKALVLEGKNSNHTIIMQNKNDISDSPLNRTIYVNVVDNYKEILKGNIQLLKYYMSTVAIACNKGIQEMIEEFISIGVMRFCKPGFMSKSEDDSLPHDGVHIGNLLVRFINKEDINIDNLGLEYTNDHKKDDILLWRLNSLINEAVKSPFYKKFYENISLPLKSLEDFRKLPILEKEHIYENSVDKSNNMITGDMKNSYIFSAGGTTGKMKYVAYSSEEFEHSKRIFGQGFRAVGINKDDFVVNYMKTGALWTAFPAVNGGLEEVGCKILSLTANQPESESIEYLKKFKPNVIISLPGNIILLAQEVEKLNEDIKLEKIFYAGEHMSPKAQEYVKKIFGAKKIASFGYAAVEIGPIGFQCECCNGTEHHVMDEWCYLERDENGDAIVTTLNRFLNPIIRYRLGDSIQWIDEPCSCGRTSKKFKLLSRSDDVIRFNVSDIYINDVHEALKDINEVSPFFQVLVDNVDEMRSVTFKIETKNKDMALKGDILKDKIVTSLKSNIRSLGIDYEKNLIKDLKVELLPPFGIERVGRTGKIRRIVDRRV
ncbi:MAG: aldehyde dehydrogenase family protein [Clostridium argentinense]|uniref:aldehyde dehydrogenase family protein n=1 Tax=Clostridium butanoliproducens TaxID=2991837 RepID=UPI001DE9294A|nr:aldehyde dehydrogenase family protein [Clostridium butanoliproducens]MBS5824156.1 aldehyde dehydrogenase family protein [Clostridium argentinense]